MARLPLDIMTVGNREDLPSGQMQVDRASPAAFGALEAGALGGLADAGVKLGGMIKANQERLKDFNLTLERQKLQQQADVDDAEARKNIPADGTGFFEQRKTANETRYRAWLDTIKDPKLRAEQEVHLQPDLRARNKLALETGLQQQDNHYKVQLGEAEKIAGQQVAQNPLIYEQVVKQQEDLINKAPYNDLVKQELKATMRGRLAAIAAPEYAKRNPAAFIGTPEATTPPGAPAGPAIPGRTNPMSPEDGSPKPKGTYKEVGNFVARGAEKVDASLRDIMKMAAERTGVKVEAYSGTRPTGSGQHPKGNAMDVRIIGEDGKPLANYQNAETFRQYEQLAQEAKRIQMEKYPHLANDFRWGGYFGGPKGKYGAVDLMHFDLGGPNMAGGDWVKGLTPAQRALFPGAVSAGMDQLPPPGSPSRTAVTPAAGTAPFTVPTGPGGPRSLPFFNDLTGPQQLAVIENATRQVKQDELVVKQAQVEQKKAQVSAVMLSIEEGTAPQMALQIAREQGILTDYEEIHRAKTALDARLKKDGDLVGAVDMFTKGYGNPFDKDHKDRADAFVTAQRKAGVDGIVAAKAFFDSTQVVAPGFAKDMRGALMANDPARVALAARTAVEMLRGRPHALAGVEGQGDIEDAALKMKYLTETRGMSDEDAVRKMMADAKDPQAKSPVRDEEIREFRKTEVTDANIRSHLGSKFGSYLGPLTGAGPYRATLPPGRQGEAVVQTYGRLVEDGFRLHRDKGLATAWADAEMAKTFGVQNGAVMQYPPSKSILPGLPGAAAPHQWVNDQALETARKFYNRPDLAADQVFVVPIDTAFASTVSTIRSGKPVEAKRYGEEPGAATTFQSVPYQILVVPKDGQQEFAPINSVYFPDVEQHVADTNARRAAEVTLNTGAPELAPPIPATFTGVKTPAQAQAETAAANKRVTDQKRADAQQLKDQLAAMPPGDPRRNSLEAEINKRDLRNRLGEDRNKK